jgi:hypothetical protein
LTASPIANLLKPVRVSTFGTTIELAAKYLPPEETELGLTLVRVLFGSVLSRGFPGVQLLLVDVVVALPVKVVVVTFCA